MQEIKSPSYIHFREQESRYARMFYTWNLHFLFSDVYTMCDLTYL